MSETCSRPNRDEIKCPSCGKKLVELHRVGLVVDKQVGGAECAHCDIRLVVTVRIKKTYSVTLAEA